MIVGDLIDGTSIIYCPLVVQVKSYVGEVDLKKTDCVDQIKEAIKYYNAIYGCIITTGDSTPALEAAVAKLASYMNTKIDVIAGDDFARMVLKNTGIDLLF